MFAFKYVVERKGKRGKEKGKMEEKTILKEEEA